MDPRYIWIQLENGLDKLKADKSDFLSSLNSLDNKISVIKADLEVLSLESQKIKESHSTAESNFLATQERYEYIKCIQSLTNDVSNYTNQIESLDPSRAATKLKEILLSLKLNLLHVYNTAKEYTTLVPSPSFTSDSIYASPLRSPQSLKNRSTFSPTSSIGMRLLLPPDTLKKLTSLINTMSKHCQNIGASWLANIEHLELIASTSAQISYNFKTHRKSSNTNQSSYDILVPSIQSMEIQFAQHIFWLSRTCQELQILVSGPPPSFSTPINTSFISNSLFGPVSNVNSPQKKLNSPLSQSISNTSSKTFQAYIQSMGPASTLFDIYAKQFEKIIEKRLKQIEIPENIENPSKNNAFLEQLYDLMVKIWVSTKLLWYDTPNLTKCLSEAENLNLETYLELHFFDEFTATQLDNQMNLSELLENNDLSQKHEVENHKVDFVSFSALEMAPVAYLDKPIYPAGLGAYCLPHKQLEEYWIKWISMIDSTAFPAYEKCSKTFTHSSSSAPQPDGPLSHSAFSNSLETLSQLVLFWGNCATGPWYGFIQNAYDPLIIAMQFLPRIQSLTKMTHACLYSMKRASLEERQAFVDQHIWQKAVESDNSNVNTLEAVSLVEANWKRVLVDCIVMLLCHPGQLQVEDFLIQSLVPSQKAISNFEKNEIIEIYQSFLSSLCLAADDRSSESLWTQNVVVGVLKSIKLGSILAVLNIKIREQLNIHLKEPNGVLNAS